MKFLLWSILLLVGYTSCEQILARISPEKSGDILINVMKCIGETGIDSDILKQINSDNKGGDEKNIQKFIFCTLRTSGLINKDGLIKADKALEYFPNNVDKQAIKKMFDVCNKENGQNLMETTFKIYKCYKEKSPVRLIL